MLSFSILTDDDKLISISVPSNLSYLYEGRVPGQPATTEFLPLDTREERKVVRSEDDNDKDDYEPMNPGISAAEIDASAFYSKQGNQFVSAQTGHPSQLIQPIFTLPIVM